MTTETFAKLVKKACQDTPESGKFYDKVFIHAAWAIGRFAYLDMSLDAFKAELWTACQAGFLSLSRADLVEAMSAYDVKRSNMSVNGATFNFIRID